MSKKTPVAAFCELNDKMKKNDWNENDPRIAKSRKQFRILRSIQIE
jgi:hypothetical protein